MKHLLLLASILLISACGSNGGGNNSADTGTITVLITDASIRDWDEALLKINAVTLIGAGGQETEILDPPQIIDLFRLENVSELLLHRTLTARKISKIRLELDSIQLNKVATDGTVIESVFPPIPTQRVDLNPQGQLEIRAGEDLMVLLDVDVANSVKITGTGSGDILFRPLIRLTAGPSGLVRLFGTIDVVSEPWVLSDVSRVSDADGVFDVLPINVVIDRSNANFFDANADPILPGSITDMGEVSVYGYYGATPDGPVLEAAIIAEGSRGTFNTFVGPVTVPWDSPSRSFSISVSEADTLPVELSTGARVFNADGEIVDETEIAVDLRTSARGKWTPDPSGLQAFVAFVGSAGDIISVDGDVFSIDGVRTTLDMVDGPCAISKPSTTYFEIVTDGGTSTISRITADQIGVGDTVVASGGEMLDGCVDADTVVKETTI